MHRFGWITLFLSIDGNEFFCEVDKPFIRDKLNCTGFEEKLTYFKYALNLLFNVESKEMKALTSSQRKTVQTDAETLYGLVHSRYILSTAGQYKMLEKYKNREYGICQRYYCDSQALLPIGLNNELNVNNVKLYCPKCEQVFNPQNNISSLDGAYFGKTFPHLFFMVFPEFKPSQSTVQSHSAEIFGFKLHKTWHKRSIETKEDLVDEFRQFQEIDKNKKEILQTDLMNNIIIDVKKEIKKNTKIIQNMKYNFDNIIEEKEYYYMFNDRDDGKDNDIVIDNDVREGDDYINYFKYPFKVYVVLDIGSMRTGISYYLNNKNNTIYVYDKWKNDKNIDKTDDVSYIKTKTAVLLQQNGNFRAFGDDAAQSYMNMEDTRLLFFEHFKRFLYDKDDQENDIDVKQNNQADKPQLATKLDLNVIAVNGKQHSLSLIFIETLKYLKTKTMNIFKDNGVNITSNSNICWVITIPSIWSDNARSRIKEYALAANMIDNSIPNQLVLETDIKCSSVLFVERISLQVKIPKQIKFIVIDAGACIIDIGCFQILNDNKTTRNIVSSGGLLGDMFIDNYFIDILSQIFNTEWINQFKKEEPNSYISLLDNFRSAKLLFNDDNDDYKRRDIDIKIPFDFIEFIKQKLIENNSNKTMNSIINNFKLNNKYINCFKLKGQTLKIDNKIWKNELFDKLIDKIIIKLEELLLNNCVKDSRYLCIVGGFSSNGYFQKRISNEFDINSKYKLEIMIENEAILSVLNGAIKNIINIKQIDKPHVNTYDNDDMDTKPKNKQQQEKCYHCKNAFNQKKYKCGGCKRIYYCSTNCQKSNWKNHQTECKLWRKQNL